MFLYHQNTYAGSKFYLVLTEGSDPWSDDISGNVVETANGNVVLTTSNSKFNFESISECEEWLKTVDDNFNVIN